MEATCKGEMVVSSPPDSEISLWSLSSCWIWSSMLLSKFYKIFIEIPLSHSPFDKCHHHHLLCGVELGEDPVHLPLHSAAPLHAQAGNKVTRNKLLWNWMIFDLNTNLLIQTVPLDIQSKQTKKITNKFNLRACFSCNTFKADGCKQTIAVWSRLLNSFNEREAAEEI